MTQKLSDQSLLSFGDVRQELEKRPYFASI